MAAQSAFSSLLYWKMDEALNSRRASSLAVCLTFSVSVHVNSSPLEDKTIIENTLEAKIVILCRESTGLGIRKRISDAHWS